MDAKVLNEIILGALGTGGVLWAAFKWGGKLFENRINRNNDKEDKIETILQSQIDSLRADNTRDRDEWAQEKASLLNKIAEVEKKQDELQDKVESLLEENSELHALLRNVVMIADQLDEENKYNFQELIG